MLTIANNSKIPIHRFIQVAAKPVDIVVDAGAVNMNCVVQIFMYKKNFMLQTVVRSLSKNSENQLPEELSDCEEEDQ